MLRSITLSLVASAAFAVLPSCSSGSSGGGPASLTGLKSTEFSLLNILERRVHGGMWWETVLVAYQNPFSSLQQLPQPKTPCIKSVTVTGDLTKGFVWTVQLVDCQDLAGVTRTMNGTVVFTGNPYKEGYSGTFSGTLAVKWEPDPDGGRALEADRLNEEAATVAVEGAWEVNSSLSGAITGKIIWSTGSATHETEVDLL